MKLLAVDTAQECYAKIENRISKGFLPMHDDLLEFRRILEWIFNEVCIEIQAPLSSLFSKMVYVSTHFALPSQTLAETHSLRKYVNDFAHEWPEVDDEKYFASVKAIAETVLFFSSVPIPESIREFYHDHLPLTLVDPNRQQYETIPFDKALVVDIEAKPFPNGNPRYILTCESELEFGRYALEVKDFRFKDSQGSKTPLGFNFSAIGKMVERYSTLNIFNLSKDQSRPYYYHTYKNTRIVLEPDYLVNASYVAKSFFDTEEGFFQTNPVIPVLSTFFGVEPNGNLFMGNLANELLDNAINNGRADFDSLFDRHQRSQVWSSINLGEQKVDQLREKAN